MLDGGDCYEAAGILFMDWFPEAVLVHGYPTLQRAPWKKFGHTWVEYEVDGQTLVRDTSNDRDVEMPTELYYHVGKINPDECRRYTMTDLRHHVTETEHWGPWEREPEGAL